MKRIDRSGLKYGMITVIDYHATINGYSTWNCKCECGNNIVIRGGDLKSGNTKSCGCTRIPELIKRKTTHGHTKGSTQSSEYRAWYNMKTRCYNPKATRFKHHGGRGITVCERWLNSFENFLEDMGKKPTIYHTLDRFPDNDGNYSPDNCRWATQSQQQGNKSSNRWIEYNGTRMILEDWTRHLGLSNSMTLSDYIKRNGVEKAMLHYAKK